MRAVFLLLSLASFDVTTKQDPPPGKDAKPVSPAPPAPKPTPADRAKEVEREITSLQARIDALRAELRKLGGHPNLTPKLFEVGQVGHLRDDRGPLPLRVVEVRPFSNNVTVRFGGMDFGILECPVPNLAEGRQLELDGLWTVAATGSARGSSSTLYWLKRYTPTPVVAAPEPSYTPTGHLFGPFLPPAVKTYTPLGCYRAGSKLKGDRVRVAGDAHAEPGKGRVLLRFSDAKGELRYVVCSADDADAGPLRGKPAGAYTVTVEGEYGGSGGGTVTLKAVKVVSAEAKP